MNDETTGLLTSADWTIPAYAQGRLWLTTGSDSTKAEGERGLFELSHPAQELTLRWLAADGAPLTQFRWQPDTLHWRGEIRAGGLVESVHLTELPGTDIPVVVTQFSAQPLLPQTHPYDTAARRDTPSATRNYLAGVDDRIDPQNITLLTSDESALARLAQDALLQAIPLHIYGHLASDDDGWAAFFALPVIWDAVTLFAP